VVCAGSGAVSGPVDKARSRDVVRREMENDLRRMIIGILDGKLGDGSTFALI